VPLITSIPYANVAISLFNESGESYIYGYVPIVVAKCGVFLKEKGKLTIPPSISVSSNTAHSNRRGGDLPPGWFGKAHKRAQVGIRHPTEMGQRA
jgi:hypothetical protein